MEDTSPEVAASGWSQQVATVFPGAISARGKWRGGGRLRVMGMSGTQKSDESRFGKPSGPVGCPLGLGLPRVLLQVKIRAHPYPGLGRLFGPAWHPCL